jgi:hypothetical protein
MHFLNPGLLLLTAIAALPLIIHILSRLRLQRAAFPSLQLIETVRRERFSRLRLKELLLLILRTLALGFLLLALARPSCRPRRSALPPGDIVILVDDSYSMAWSDNMNRARAACRAIITGLSGGRRCAVLTTSGSVSSGGLTSHRRRLLALADSLRPSYSACRLEPALTRSLELALPTRAAVAILTDLQDRALPDSLHVPAGQSVLLVDIGSVAANAAVVRVLPERPFVLPGRPVRLTALFANYGSRPLTRTAVLVLDERREERTVTLRPVATDSVTFGAAIDRPGVVSGRVELHSDSLEADDTRHFAFDLPARLDLLVVQSAAVPARYVTAALGTDSVSLFGLTVIDAAEFGRHDPRRYAAVVVTDAASLKTADWDRLDFHIRSGGGALVMFGPDIAPLARHVRDLGRSGGTGFVTVAETDTSDQVLALLSGTDFAAARFSGRARLDPLAGRVLARFAGGDPAIIAAEGQLRLWAFPPLPGQTNLVHKAAFVPLLHRTLVQLSLSPTASSYPVGDTVRFDLQSSAPITLTTPSGSSALTPEPGIVFSDTRTPGLYRLNSEPPRLFAINVDPAESDLSRAEAGRPAGLGFRVVGADALSGVREMSETLLWLAVAAFALEMLLLAV